jgi:hypothetical protein
VRCLGVPALGDVGKYGVVAEADTVPPCLLFAADSSSIAEDSVSIRFMTIRLSAREVTPSVTCKLVLN